MGTFTKLVKTAVQRYWPLLLFIIIAGLTFMGTRPKTKSEPRKHEGNSGDAEQGNGDAGPNKGGNAKPDHSGAALDPVPGPAVDPAPGLTPVPAPGPVTVLVTGTVPDPAAPDKEETNPASQSLGPDRARKSRPRRKHADPSPSPKRHPNAEKSKRYREAAATPRRSENAAPSNTYSQNVALYRLKMIKDKVQKLTRIKLGELNDDSHYICARIWAKCREYSAWDAEVRLATELAFEVFKTNDAQNPKVQSVQKVFEEQNALLKKRRQWKEDSKYRDWQKGYVECAGVYLRDYINNLKEGQSVIFANLREPYHGPENKEITEKVFKEFRKNHPKDGNVKEIARLFDEQDHKRIESMLHSSDDPNWVPWSNGMLKRVAKEERIKDIKRTKKFVNPRFKKYLANGDYTSMKRLRTDSGPDAKIIAERALRKFIENHPNDENAQKMAQLFDKQDHDRQKGGKYYDKFAKWSSWGEPDASSNAQPQGTTTLGAEAS